MSARKIILSLLLVFGFGAGQGVYASDDHKMGGHGIEEMAKILMHLNHRPSASEKDTLHEIIRDSSSSANEKTIAQALINLDHQVAGGDARKLQAITNDDSATPSERQMATILLDLNHKPSSDDKDTLRKIAK